MKPQTKVIIRRLPKGLTKDEFLNAIQPYNRFNYFRFCYSDPNHKDHSSTRVYIDFYSEDDMYRFKNDIENIIFADNNGNQSYAIIEFAAYPKTVGKPKLDTKQNTLACDPDYLQFLKDQSDTTTNSALTTVESNLEEIKNRDADRLHTTTALIDYITNLRKKDRMRKEDYRKKNDYQKSFAKKDPENFHENNNKNKMEIKAIKKNTNRDTVGDNFSKTDAVKIADKIENKKAKAPRRNDIKTYASNYEEYQKETNGYTEDRTPKRIFDNKGYRGGRKPMYDMVVDEPKGNSGSYYYNNRNDGYYRHNDNQYGYSDTAQTNYARPAPNKNRRGGGRPQPPPSYSATRQD